MKKLKIIFIGTGDIAIKLLTSLAQNADFEIVLVVSGPDKAVGRKMEIQPSALKMEALELGLPLYQPENIKNTSSLEKIKSLAPDLMVVMAYGQILSQEILDIPKIECLNVHASLLPKYRGASPIQSVILKGEKKTGLSLMKMVKKMDAGDVYQKFEIRIDETDTAQSLEEKLSHLSADTIPAALQDVAAGKLTAEKQNEDEVTYVHKITKSEGQIDWKESAEMIERKIRAFNPWPSTYTFFKGKRLKINLARAHDKKVHKPAGSVFLSEESVMVVTGEGVLELLEVQMEGKKVQKIKEFINGNQDFMGAMLQPYETH